MKVDFLVNGKRVPAGEISGILKAIYLGDSETIRVGPSDTVIARASGTNTMRAFVPSMYPHNFAFTPVAIWHISGDVTLIPSQENFWFEAMEALNQVLEDFHRSTRWFILHTNAAIPCLLVKVTTSDVTIQYLLSSVPDQVRKLAGTIQWDRCVHEDDRLEIITSDSEMTYALVITQFQIQAEVIG